LISFRWDGPCVPARILRPGRFVTVIGCSVVEAGGLALELVEQGIKVLPVEHQARALRDGHQVRPPLLVEGAALHADVGQRLVIRQASVHR